MSGHVDYSVPIGGQVLGPIVINPGSSAFDDPDNYGDTLLYKNLKEYIDGLSQPVWNHWLNYEIKLLEKTRPVFLS
jgi:hypothetical protein